jgi:hypothetical protein
MEIMEAEFFHPVMLDVISKSQGETQQAEHKML